MRLPLAVLVLCTANSARSILSEAILRDAGGDRFTVRSAGSQPRGEPNPKALKLLEAKGHATAGLRSKSWEEFAGPDAAPIDLVITVCDDAAGESCPIFPGPAIKVHWGIEDPAGAPDEDEAFARAYDQLTERFEALIALPVEQMEPESLREAAQRIGAMSGATHAAQAASQG